MHYASCRSHAETLLIAVFRAEKCVFKVLSDEQNSTLALKECNKINLISYLESLMSNRLMNIHYGDYKLRTILLMGFYFSKLWHVRVEIMYSSISIFAVGFLVRQYSITTDHFWFVCLLFCCTKLIIGIYLYEVSRANGIHSIRKMLPFLLFRFI